MSPSVESCRFERLTRPLSRQIPGLLQEVGSSVEGRRGIAWTDYNHEGHTYFRPQSGATYKRGEEDEPSERTCV